jgi:hypothetical protein
VYTPALVSRDKSVAAAPDGKPCETHRLRKSRNRSTPEAELFKQGETGYCDGKYTGLQRSSAEL